MSRESWEAHCDDVRKERKEEWRRHAAREDAAAEAAHAEDMKEIEAEMARERAAKPMSRRHAGETPKQKYEAAVAVRTRVTEAFCKLIPLRGTLRDDPRARRRLWKAIRRLETICHHRFNACAREVMAPRYAAAKAAERAL